MTKTKDAFSNFAEQISSQLLSSGTHAEAARTAREDHRSHTLGRFQMLKLSYFFKSSKKTIAQFLTSIILDAKHETIVWNNQDFFPILNPKKLMHTAP